VEREAFYCPCSDTVGWATGRASGLYIVECWFVGGDNLTGALHILYSSSYNHLHHPCCSKIHNGGILVLAYSSCTGKQQLNGCRVKIDESKHEKNTQISTLLVRIPWVSVTVDVRLEVVKSEDSALLSDCLSVFVHSES